MEIDETYIGGKEKNRHANKKHRAGRGPVTKQAVFGMRTRDGRVVAKPITDTSAKTIGREVYHTVEPGSMLYTDELPAYKQFHGRYGHETVNHTVKEFVNGMASTNGIESVWAVLKRGYNGVYHQWSWKPTARYVNEFVFRLKEGNVARHTMKRLESLVKGAIGKRLTYRELTAE